MPSSRRKKLVRETSAGIRILDLGDPSTAALIRHHGLDPNLEPWRDVGDADRAALGPRLEAFAKSLARAFLSDDLDFWAADAAISAVVGSLDFECPELVLRLFLAFEDAETDPDPSPKARRLVSRVLEEAAV